MVCARHGSELTGWKSSMQDTKVKTKALDKSNCAVARPGGKEAGVKTTSPRTETGCEAGDADEFAPQNEVHEDQRHR